MGYELSSRHRLHLEEHPKRVKRSAGQGQYAYQRLGVGAHQGVFCIKAWKGRRPMRPVWFSL